MSYILHINTALELAAVCVSENNRLIAARKSTEQKEHASFLQQAMQEAVAASGIRMSELSAVSVLEGPGSYTGLRVGMAGAKGLCYALNIPLVKVNTLEWMAEYYMEKDSSYLCPAIDARRNEIFTALYDPAGKVILPPFAHILSPESFKEHLDHQPVHFFGNGAQKCAAAIKHPNAVFSFVNASDNQELINLSWGRFQSGRFADLVYCEPLYVKEFYSTAKK